METVNLEVDSHSQIPTARFPQGVRNLLYGITAMLLSGSEIKFKPCVWQHVLSDFQDNYSILSHCQYFSGYLRFSILF